VAASNGVAILPDARLGDADLSADRVFVCAGGNPATVADRALFGALRRLARWGVTIGGISGGPYILARAGLLAGRRCTLHWEHIPAFSERFPDAIVARSLFEIEGDRITCSGGISALDMMLHLIAAEHGPGLAARVSEWFVHTQMREGPAPQRMALALRSGVTDPRLLRVLAAMEAHLERPLGRPALAGLAHLSVRQVERLFRDRLGESLHARYLRLRLERARQLRAEGSLSAAEIALATGFPSAGALARAARARAGGGESPGKSPLEPKRSPARQRGPGERDRP
jgi:transcriptional regulator GlxA family with amidase domain